MFDHLALDDTSKPLGQGSSIGASLAVPLVVPSESTILRVPYNEIITSMGNPGSKIIKWVYVPQPGVDYNYAWDPA
ncbi:hypothetical protein C5167_011548 [Papaver somniferum]|uniref:Uncharacterized protein n=1 Tax=Papaver somniferum TaxID=3469 RepID=A0A4Y7K4M6_PAPSO|nr:hypothetical protein C5167_011548 [Papaver somniferum]